MHRTRFQIKGPFSPEYKASLDLLLWTMLVPIAFWVRVEYEWVNYPAEIFWLAGVGIVLKSIALTVFGFHRRSWHRIGILDLGVLLVGIAYVTFGLVVANVFIGAPRSIPFIEGTLAVVVLGGIRVASRIWYERKAEIRPQRRNKKRRAAQNVLIIGAGEAGTRVCRELLRNPGMGKIPIGFLDDDPAKQGLRFVGLPVFDNLETLPSIVEQFAVDQVLVAIPSDRARVARRVLHLARHAGVGYAIVPGMDEILGGGRGAARIRDLNLEDLLRREPVKLDTASIASYLRGRVVLVTGAGGSIGSEIVRQVMPFGPRKVILLGRGENSVFQIRNEMRIDWPDAEVVPVICDVRNRDKLIRIFEKHAPEVVFHAAAHKHVPLMEENPDEAVLNNVGGTRNIAELCLGYGTARLVNISTDKAVNPASYMGASKRVAEQIVEYNAARASSDQRFVSVRFGNVLGSRGSVVPFFQEQIRRGGPVTVTHPDMQRYFMTIHESAQLVLQAGSMAENGYVYVLDMGEPVRIVELAEDLILLSGYEPGRDIGIEFSGVRAGEKLFEEILTAEEGTVASRHSKIFVARKSSFDEDYFSRDVENLFQAARSFDEPAVKSAFGKLIPSYLGGKYAQQTV